MSFKFFVFLLGTSLYLMYHTRHPLPTYASILLSRLMINSLRNEQKCRKPSLMSFFFLLYLI